MSATTIDVYVASPPVVDVTIVSDPVFEVLGVLPTGPRGPAGDAGPAGADGAAGPQGDPGEGVPVGGTAGQVLTKDTATDFDTSWQDPTGGGGSGVVETIVAGSNIDVDATDPANPVVSVEALVDADIPASIARDTEVTAAVDAEAALARNADNLTSGTVVDARIASTIARDSEVTSAVAAEATARDAAIETHRADTTNVHGIADASALLDTGDIGTSVQAHSAVLDATTASFLTADETKLDGIEAGAQVNPSTEAIQDIVGGMVVGGTETGIAVTYDDVNARLDFVAEVTQTELDAKAADSTVVHDTGDETIAGVKTFSSDPIIPDEAYGVGWNESLEPPTKNAVYDKIETIGGGTNIATSTLTDKTSWSATSTLEQWGTEEAVLAQASAPATAMVWAILSGTARNLDGAVNRGGDSRVEISLDGGSTWTPGVAVYYEIIGSASGNPATGITAQAVHSGAVTGDIQARVRSQSFSATTGPDLIRGTLTMHVTAA